MQVRTKKKLLIMIDWFLPGYKAGGQIQSCANLADALQDVFDIYVITTDRDLGDTQAYDSIIPDHWNSLQQNIQVFYISAANLRYTFMLKVVLGISPDCIYINSMFSWHFTVLPLLISRRNFKGIRLILAPRGMLHAGALQYSRFKKRLFLAVFKAVALQKQILFQATDEIEQNDTRKVFGSDVKVRLVQDFNASFQQPFEPVRKEQGELKCLFVSRIAQKKNLLFLVSLLQQVTAVVTLTIAGPVEEEAYWNECKQVIGQLPPNISVLHAGPVPHRQLDKIYADHHLFILPTFGENFGHVIFESLLHGRPVLISDKTPWQDLEQQGAGWALSLDDQESFLSILRTACAWNQEDFDKHAKAAWQYASDYIRKADLKEKYVNLFDGGPTRTPPGRG